MTTIALFLSLTTLAVRFVPAKASALPVSAPLTMQNALPPSSDREDSQNQAPDSPVNSVDNVDNLDSNDAHSHCLVVHFTPTLENFDVPSSMAVPLDHSIKPLLPPPNPAALL